jgi:preprotein translocase subunit YajC
MKGAAQIGLFGILLILLLVYFFLIYLPQKDVNYLIQLQNNKIQKGTNVVLFYKITNGLNFPVQDVVFHYIVGDIQQEFTVNIGTIQANSEVPKSVELQTRNFDSGKYTIWTELSYSENGVLKEKALTLQIEIF